MIDHGAFSREFGEASASRLLMAGDRPTALIAGGYQILLGVIASVRAFRLSIPDDVSMIAFDNPDALQFVAPPISAVSLLPLELGRGAAELLLARLKGETPPDMIVTPVFRPRASCGPRRAGRSGPRRRLWKRSLTDKPCCRPGSNHPVWKRFPARGHLSTKPSPKLASLLRSRPDVRLRRSCLAVPGSSEKMLAKAAGLPADQVFLDLEDAVAPSEKNARTRDHVVRALVDLEWGTTTRVVRVNTVGTSWCLDDVVHVVSAAGAALDCIMAQRLEPVPVEVVDHLAHMRLSMRAISGALINVFEAQQDAARSMGFILGDIYGSWRELGRQIFVIELNYTEHAGESDFEQVFRNEGIKLVRAATIRVRKHEVLGGLKVAA